MSRKIERFIRCCSCTVVLIFAVVLILALLAQGNSAKVIAFDKPREISVKSGVFDFQLLTYGLGLRITGELKATDTVTVYPTDMGFIIDFHEPVTDLHCSVGFVWNEIDAEDISICEKNAGKPILLYVEKGTLHWQFLDEPLINAVSVDLEDALFLVLMAAAGIFILRHIALKQVKEEEKYDPSDLTYDDFLSGKV